MKFQLTLAAVLAGGFLMVGATSAAAAPLSGQQVFEGRCMSCHSLQPAPSKMGPPLAGVIGRKTASVPGYAYSSAMQQKKGYVWTPEMVDIFLQGPNKLVPGTKMPIGLSDAEQRAAVIQYLGSIKK